MTPGERPPVAFQGKAVVEPDGEGGLLVLLPDGEIRGAATPARAVQMVRRWFRTHLPGDSLGVGLIEWRGGAAPPSEKK